MRAMRNVSGASLIPLLTSRMRSTLHHLETGRRGESSQDRDQGRGSLCARRARRRKPNGPSAAHSQPRLTTPFKGFEEMFKSRIDDADEFYERITPNSLNEDERRVHRQALAGMLWSKQYYYFDLEKWLKEHHSHPMIDSVPHSMRNTEWFHMLNADIISMPDKWEYPWYAAWDLAFHTITLWHWWISTLPKSSFF